MPSLFLRTLLAVALLAATLVASALLGAPSPPLRELAAEEGSRGFDPRFREGAPSDVLVPGPPRLTRGHLNAFVDLFESAFDVALPGGIEQDLRAALQEEYAAGDEHAREAFLGLVDGLPRLRARARCCDWPFVHAGLRRFRTAIDRRLRKAREVRSNELMLSVLRRRHEVVWRGEPALKALAVESYLELAVFVASLGRNEAIRLTPGQIQALREYLEKDLRRCRYATRDCLVGVHRTWLRAKARWDRSRDRRRLAMRWQAVRLLARLAPAAGGVSIPGASECATRDHRSYVRAASKVADADRAFEAVTAVARNPKALLDATCCGLGLSGQAPPFTFLYR